MPLYTFHRVAQVDGTPVATTEYECNDDESALAHAMENAGRCAIEIWRGKKKVGFVDGGLMGISKPRLGLTIPDCDPQETGSSKSHDGGESVT